MRALTRFRSNGLEFCWVSAIFFSQTAGNDCCKIQGEVVHYIWVHSTTPNSSCMVFLRRIHPRPHRIEISTCVPLIHVRMADMLFRPQCSRHGGQIKLTHEELMNLIQAVPCIALERRSADLIMGELITHSGGGIAVLVHCCEGALARPRRNTRARGLCGCSS